MCCVMAERMGGWWCRTKCSTECHFTADHGKLGEAQGVLFHGPNHSPHDFPGHKPEGQKWIFMSLEQPHYFRDPGLLGEGGGVTPHPNPPAPSSTQTSHSTLSLPDQ